MVKVKATLSLDEGTYRKFQKWCKNRDIMLSKRIERLMNKEMEGKK
jgi:hypothetical protein